MTLLDPALVRAQFPALDDEWVWMDNAGGSAPCRQVTERVRAYMETLPVQLGGTYRASVEAGEAVAAGRAAAATLLGAEPDEVVVGSSSTVLTQRVAQLIGTTLRAGDEVVVTNADHESNIGPWRALEAAGMVVREWRIRTDTLTLELEDLDALLNARTRVVAFTHCSNVLGAVVDAREVVRRAHAAGALAFVDAVAYAPHRALDVRALDADLCVVSLYKVFGPHMAVLYGRRAVLDTLPNASHFFFTKEATPGRFEPGGMAYELTASLPGILEYFATVVGDDALRGRALVETFFERADATERALAAPLLAYLAERPDVRIIGSPTMDESRVPTVAFTVDGRQASAIPRGLDELRIAVRYGHFYAHRLVEALGLHEREGVVRVSLAHYTTSGEVDRLIDGLEAVLR